MSDPLEYERRRYAEIEARAQARDLTLRREMVRAEHRARHEREMAEYRASPVARRIRFSRLKAHLRSLGKSFRAGSAAGRARVMNGPVVRAERKSLGQRLRGIWSRVRGRSRGGNGQRERVRVERPQPQRQAKAPPQQTRTSWAGPEQQRARAKSRTRRRSRGQRVR